MNKYVKAFKESCEKLEEITAATRYFANPDSHKNLTKSSNMISEANDIFAALESFMNDYHVIKDFEKSSEYNTNSQAARIYKAIKQMYNFVPEGYNADAYETDLMSKDF